jgi:hypothetical protein
MKYAFIVSCSGVFSFLRLYPKQGQPKVTGKTAGQAYFVRNDWVWKVQSFLRRSLSTLGSDMLLPISGHPKSLGWTATDEGRDLEDVQNEELDHLADVLEENMDMDLIDKIIGIGGGES